MGAIILAQAGENVQCLPVFITLLLVISSDRSSLGYDKQTNKQTRAKKETNQCNLMLQRNNLMQLCKTLHILHNFAHYAHFCTFCTILHILLILAPFAHP